MIIYDKYMKENKIKLDIEAWRNKIDEQWNIKVMDGDKRLI